jgi:N-acyl-D-amino-acid deacylase
MFDLIVRGGVVIDGSGGEPYRADIAINGNVIADIGQLDATARHEVDAAGCLVTPGFVDIHTHYDGQAIWSPLLTPSSAHGVTTVVIGNCGVGFAPCRPADHALLVNTMEGVEDIPEVVMTRGLSWDWETFPQYLDALDRSRHDIDIGVLLPHSPLRVFVMGERGAAREPATDADIRQMASVMRQAISAGALGFASSRTEVHRRGDGEFLPSFRAEAQELRGIAAGMSGRGLVQIVTNLARGDSDESRSQEIDLLADISRTARVPVTFSLPQPNASPALFAQALQWTDRANADARVSIHPQFAPRPIGVYIGLELSTNPFADCPSYRSLAHLPLEARVRKLREPELRRRIVAEPPAADAAPIVRTARQFEQTYRMSDPPCYEPERSLSVAAQAASLGISSEELAYDWLLEDDGHSILYVAMSNYGYGNLDHVADAFSHPQAVVGLGDGGAHYGMICDASYPTFMLTYWARDRASRTIALPAAVQMLTSIPAALAGLLDRGLLGVGYKADLNVIDHDALRLHPPQVCYDLPAGGRRINQTAAGYRTSIVSGIPIRRDGEDTGALPGRLVRGRQPVPRQPIRPAG